jgi:CIC family chloride channel protein
MRRMERLGRSWKIPIHTQVRLAHNCAEAILEVIRQRHINCLVMGWKGSTSTQGMIFGDVVDTLIHKAPCELILVKLGNISQAFPHFTPPETSWLIPIAGGPNAKRAIQLLPALASLAPNFFPIKTLICQVHLPSETEPNFKQLEKTAKSLEKRLNLPVIPIPLCAASIAEAIITLASVEDCSLVMLGASREGLLKQAIYGNIPNAIAQGVNSTVILVRGAIKVSESIQK